MSTDFGGDIYNRIKISDTHYRCGCYWYRDDNWGDVLKQCALHHQHTVSSVVKFERENK